MARIALEVCVDSIAGLDAAVAGGADRIELCAALDLGGLTPSPGFMAAAARCGLPVHAMIRPRAGGFVVTPAEVAVMQRDIAAARAAGMQGVVLGASLPDGRLDSLVLSQLVAAAEGLSLTLHRAFDLVPDLGEAVALAVELGFDRILTSGRAETAIAGLADIAATFVLAAGRIAIMPGAGITAANARRLRHLPLTDVHASCRKAAPSPARAVALGFAAATSRETDATAVRALKSALAD